MTIASSGDSIRYWETSAMSMQRVVVGRTNSQGAQSCMHPGRGACAIETSWQEEPCQMRALLPP
jgi:hypothetical protein